LVWGLTAAGQLTDLAAELERANRAGQNVYIGANPRLRNGGTAADVAMARSVFADLDHMAVADALRRIDDSGLPQPTITVASGHGLHAYWRFAEPLTDLAGWTAAQKQFIGLLHSDKAIHDAPRIMRLPAFTNHKPPRAKSRVVQADPERRYDRADILAIISGSESETQEDTVTEPSLPSVGSVGSIGSVTLKPEEIVQLCLPTRQGERDSCILRLARGLRFDAGLGGLSWAELKPIVRQWHRLALRTIGTKDFDESWAAFIRAWGRAFAPLTANPIDGAWALAQEQLSGGSLPTCADDYDSQPVKVLVALYASLAALQSSGRCFLSCHDAGARLGVAPIQVHRWLKMLIADGVLAVVKPGDKRWATRYRFIGSGDAADSS
jgi:hypothetical protein